MSIGAESECTDINADMLSIKKKQQTKQKQKQKKQHARTQVHIYKKHIHLVVITHMAKEMLVQYGGNEMEIALHDLLEQQQKKKHAPECIRTQVHTYKSTHILCNNTWPSMQTYRRDIGPVRGNQVHTYKSTSYVTCEHTAEILVQYGGMK